MLERILIVEDDAAVRESLALQLAAEGFDALTAQDADEALTRMRSLPVDIVLCAAEVAGLDGFELIPQLQRICPDAAFILTATADAAALAAQALERGVHDYVAKPASRVELLLALRRVRERTRLRRTGSLLQRELHRAIGERPIVAASQSMIALLEMIEHMADFKTTVLLCGEPGTGKETLARVIHAQSPRRAAPFIAVTCPGQDERRFAADLFGHASGVNPGGEQSRAGLFAQADRGTIFLDEISALSESMQLEVMRVLQEEEIRPVGSAKSQAIDVRIIASTSRDLAREVSQGRFREDLHARLEAGGLEVPPLRERRADIPLLADHCLAGLRERLGKPVRFMADDALERLSDHPWPGNVRELENALERAAIRAEGERITIHDLPHAIVRGADDEGEEAPGSFNLRQARRAFEAQLIRRALRTTDGNRTHAAKLLEISHRALLYKLKEYAIKD